MKRVLPAVLLIACGSPSKPATPTSPTSPTPTAPTVPAAPASACTNLPAGYEAFADLKWGESLDDPELGFSARKMDLGPFFPQLAGKVAAATPVEVDGDPAAPEMAAIWVPEGKTQGSGLYASHEFVISLFRCGASGFEKIGQDLPQGEGVMMIVLATQPIQLPDGTWGSSLRLTHSYDVEMQIYEHVFGHGAEIGQFEVGQSFVVEGGGGQSAYWRAIDASGWFSDGKTLRFIGLTYSYDPDVPEPTGLYPVTLAIFEGGRLIVDDYEQAAWVLLGAGALPSWCGAGVRCSAIDPEEVQMIVPTGKRYAYTWLAGAWGTAEAAKAAIEAAGGAVTDGDWAYLGLVDDESGEPAPLGPDGKAPAPRNAFTP